MNNDREILLDLIRACELSIQFCADIDNLGDPASANPNIIYQEFRWS